MRPGSRTQAVAAASLILSTLLLVWVGWSWWSPPAATDPDATPAHDAGVASPSVHAPAGPPGLSDPTTTWTPLATQVRRFQIPSAGYDSPVGTMEVADAGVINPPDFVRTWWIRDRGVIPSSQATDTTYLACHTDSAKAASAVPCNRVGVDDVPVGSKVLVETDAEQLSYTVVQSRTVPRGAFADDDEVWGVHPGRLVWVSCHLSGGRRTDYNFVVVAELDA